MSRIYPFIFVLVCLVVSPLSQAIVPPPPKLPADAFFLIDANTGEVLVDHNSDLSLPPASLTKIMTSYVLAEEVESGRASLDDPVTVDEESWAHLENRERLTANAPPPLPDCHPAGRL